MNSKFSVIYFNETYLLHQDFQVSAADRSFRYGDGLFETLYASGGQIVSLKEHLQRMRHGLEVLRLRLPAFYTDDYLEQCMKGVLTRCKLFQGASLKLSVWRHGEGKFRVQDQGVNVLIEAVYANEGEYVLNKDGLSLGLYKEPLLHKSVLSSVKSRNALPYIIAASFAVENNLDDALLLSSKGFLAEASSANLFFVKQGVVYTPSLETGCLPGVMRGKVLGLLQQMQYNVEEGEFLPSVLLEADEVFLSNANGLKWVLAFQNRRYLKRIVKQLVLQLNEKL